MTSVNPDVLRWARETAGLDEVEAARRLGVGDARGVTATDRLGAWEEGKDSPSRAVLFKMATVYRRPLVSFYAAQAPEAAPRVEDFRKLVEHQPAGEPLVQALVRDIRTRQSVVRSLMEDDDASPLPFVGSLTLGAREDDAVAAIIRAIDFDLSVYRKASDPEKAFAYLRGRAEAVGVFVLLIGDLGSHHTELDTEAFRGFALADQVAPFVVINDRDAAASWSFTLLHELVHVWLGTTGVSGGRPEGRIERFCNEVAGRILLPDAELATLTVTLDGTDDPARQISDWANARRLSRTMVAFRLFRAGRLPEKLWLELRARFRTEWLKARQKRRDTRDKDAGGPDYYVVRRQRLGPALLTFVGRMVREGTLTPTKAGRVLGVRPRSVEPLLRGRAA